MLLEEAEEHVKAFSRSDVYYNRDVEKLAAHFDDDANSSIRERRASTLAMNKYRMSVSGMSSNDNNFGRSKLEDSPPQWRPNNSTNQSN